MELYEKGYEVLKSVKGDHYKIPDRSTWDPPAGAKNGAIGL